MNNKLKVQHYFDAAHQLKDSPDLVTKACARLHGHTYAVIVEAKTEVLNGAGMVVDFKAIKQIIDRLDHRFINAVLEDYKIDMQPTAENIAAILAKWVTTELNVVVTRVSVCEGYKGAERASWAVYEP
jgi:6-pyruvoyltetrahydropterin/6-carboxytetrahydropterin synthase